MKRTLTIQSFDWPLFSKMKVMMIARMPFCLPRVRVALIDAGVVYK